MQRLRKKLETIFEASGGKKVDIVSHSMGGRLVKSFLTLHHEVKITFTLKFRRQMRVRTDLGTQHEKARIKLHLRLQAAPCLSNHWVLDITGEFECISFLSSVEQLYIKSSAFVACKFQPSPILVSLFHVHPSFALRNREFYCTKLNQFVNLVQDRFLRSMFIHGQL